MKKKILASAVVAALALCCVIGGTLAWLTAKTEPLVNTFTVGDVDIALEETTGDTYKMLPGCTIAKDPTVTVTKESEDCWLFVEVDESANFDNFMTYAMADGWDVLNDETGVFYRKVKTDTADQAFAVLKDNKVTVLNTVTKNMMNDLTQETYPTLTFTAYAVQQHKDNGDFTPADAWKTVSGSTV